MVVPEYVRPILLIVIGWFMGTHQMIRKHSNAATSELLLLHPAYCFFYTMFAGAAFVLVYQEWDRRQDDADVPSKCSDYFYDTYDKFGFIADAFGGGDRVMSVFLLRMGAVFATQLVVAFGFAWELRRRTAKLKDAKTFRVWIFRYSITALALGMCAYVMLTFFGGGNRISPPATIPCAFDPRKRA
jgi:hypothetical protein